MFAVSRCALKILTEFGETHAFLNTSIQALWNSSKWGCIHVRPLSVSPSLLSQTRSFFASLSHSLQTMTNRCISCLIAEITNEMPYELPGLPPLNESPGQFAWEVIESPAVREKRDVLRITANWLLWECGMKSHFRALNAKGLLSHSCRVHFSQPFPSTPAFLRAGWWLVNGLRSGALVLTGKWPITPSCGNPESNQSKGGEMTLK